MRKRLIIISSLSLLLVAFSVIGFQCYRLIYSPMLSGSSQPLILQVDKNTSASSFVRDLYARHLLQTPRLFLWFIRSKGLSNHLKAGAYAIKPEETAWQFLQRVVAGDVMILPFRIIEGTTLSVIQAQFEHLPYLIQQPDGWSKITEGHSSAEGLLLADTYHYDAGSQSTHLLMTAHNSLMQLLNDAWQKRTVNLPYKTPYELLIAASIIEKEASKPEEKRLIAGVIMNRLNKRMPLQMDPTVIYALGSQFQGKLTHQDLSIDSPYNTYKHYGLPPTPIAMVGKDAIDAAAHPTLTHYLYFVARGDGTHQFSETYDQQQQAVSTYR